jgi:uncharacterized membrane protein/osmotically-inducible protein OsmY
MKMAKTAKTAFRLGRRGRSRPLFSRTRLAVRGRRGMGMTLLGGVGTGVALMYLFDPDRGARRRALARNKAAHLVSVQRNFLQKSVRDAQHRSSGLLARMSMHAHDVSPDVLVARVRAELGRHVSHASSIDVEVDNGIVTLHGPVLLDEVRGLMRAIRRVPGAKDVHNDLEMHDREDGVPGLQGQARMPRPVLAREHWPPAYRLVSAGGGLITTVYGLLRGGIVGRAISAGGGALLLRAIVDRPLRQIFGMSTDPTVTIQKTVTVDVPVEEVYRLWSQPENFPMFMEHVVQVDTEPDGKTSHWRVTGPAGTPLQWDAELVDDTPGERLSWRTTAGTLAHTGEVRFEIVDTGTTRVHVRMEYAPPAGFIGHSIASLLGQDPKHALDGDLVRMKSLLEEGKTTVRGQTMEVGVHQSR